MKSFPFLVTTQRSCRLHQRSSSLSVIPSRPNSCDEPISRLWRSRPSAVTTCEPSSSRWNFIAGREIRRRGHPTQEMIFGRVVLGDFRRDEIRVEVGEGHRGPKLVEG